MLINDISRFKYFIKNNQNIISKYQLQFILLKVTNELLIFSN